MKPAKIIALAVIVLCLSASAVLANKFLYKTGGIENTIWAVEQLKDGRCLWHFGGAGKFFATVQGSTVILVDEKGGKGKLAPNSRGGYDMVNPQGQILGSFAKASRVGNMARVTFEYYKNKKPKK